MAGFESDQPVLDRSVIAQMEADVEPGMIPALVAAFRDEIGQRRARIAEALAAGELEPARAEAHSLKSSAGAFGTLALAELAAALDAAGKDSDGARMATLAEELETAAADADAALAAYLDAAQA